MSTLDQSLTARSPHQALQEDRHMTELIPTLRRFLGLTSYEVATFLAMVDRFPTLFVEADEVRSLLAELATIRPLKPSDAAEPPDLHQRALEVAQVDPTKAGSMPPGWTSFPCTKKGCGKWFPYPPTKKFRAPPGTCYEHLSASGRTLRIQSFENALQSASRPRD